MLRKVHENARLLHNDNDGSLEISIPLSEKELFSELKFDSDYDIYYVINKSDGKYHLSIGLSEKLNER